MSADEFLDEKGDSLTDNEKLVKLVKYQNGNLDFNTDIAKLLFECPEVKSSPVAIITVLGKGKSANSMLLSKMIYYMQNPQTGGSGETSEADIIANFKTLILESSPDEMSIITWSKPLFVSLGVCGKVAVFFLHLISGSLSDDMLTIPEDRVKTFYELAGLCLYLSSNAVYIEIESFKNVDWSHLARIIAEGLRCAEPKQHQKMTFLIRDWIHPSIFAHGEKGGKNSLQCYIDENPSPQLVSQIPPAFSELNCFLLPPFGPDNEKQVQINFDKQYGKFLETVLGHCYITPKNITGCQIKGSEILELIQDYIASVESNNPPINLAELRTENNSHRDNTESRTPEEIVAQIRNRKPLNGVAESSILSQDDGDTDRLRKSELNIEFKPISVPTFAFGNSPSLTSKPTMSLNEYLGLRSERSNDQKREENLTHVTECDIQDQSKRQRHESREENLQLLLTTTPEDILKKYKRKPVAHYFKGTNFQAQLQSTNPDLSPVVPSSEIDHVPPIHKYDTSDALLEFTDNDENNSNQMHNNFTIASDFAIVVAAKYFKSEVINAKDAAHSGEDLRNAQEQITVKINNALKYACDLSSTELTTKHKEELQMQFELEFRNVQAQEIPKSTIGIHLSTEEITARTFVKGRCKTIISSSEPGRCTDGIWFIGNKITFENPRTYESAYISLKQLLVTSAEGTVKVGHTRFLSVNKLLEMIFREIKQSTESQLNSTISLCIIALPVPFNSIQRDLVRGSAQLAGFERVELIDELCAAAISYTMEPDSPTPKDLLVVIYRQDALSMACYRQRIGQLTQKSILWQKLSNCKTQNMKRPSIDAFDSMNLEVRAIANFGDDTVTLLVSSSGVQIPLSIKEQTQQPFKTRPSNVTRGAAIYAGLIGGNKNLRENWNKATSSEFADWENVLTAFKKSGLRE